MDGVDQLTVGLKPHRTRITGADDLTVAYRDWGMDCLQLSRGAREGILFAAALGSLRFRSMDTWGAMRLRGASPAHHVTVQIDLGSSAGRHLSGQHVEADDMIVGLGSVDFEFITHAHNHGMNIALPEQLALDAFARRAPGAERSAGSGLLQVVSHCGPRVDLIRRVAARVFALSDRLVDMRTPAFASSAMADALISALLVPWHRQGEASFRAPRYQRLPIVRRAEEFMHANLGEPIMLHDICEGARASERAVGYAFHDVYGMGAKHYLRVLRLNRVRRELKAQRPEAASVAGIAQRYGFWHMGHFSTDYRRLFGETPQQTGGGRQMNPKWPPPLPAVPSLRSAS